MRNRRGLFRDLVGKPERKKPPGRPSRRSEVNIIRVVTEVGWVRGLGLP